MASRESTGQCSTVYTGAGEDPRPTQGMQQFATGATRGNDDVKIDFEGHLSPEALRYFGQYMHSHRVTVTGDRRASDNWQQGIPLHKYVKSLIRHTIDLWRAWRGTTTYNPETGKAQTLGELSAAILFNVQGFLHELVKAGATENYYVTEEMRRDIEHGGHATAVFSPMKDTKEAEPASGPVGSLNFTCPQDGERNCCPGDGAAHSRCIVFAARRKGSQVSR